MSNEDILWFIRVSGKESYDFKYRSKTTPTLNDAAIFVRNAIFKDEAVLVTDQNRNDDNKAYNHLCFLGYKIDSIEPAEVK